MEENEMNLEEEVEETETEESAEESEDDFDFELDENGNASFQVEGRNKEICFLVGDLIASCAEYDKNNAKKCGIL